MIHKTTRSILSVLLAALLLVTSTPLTPAFAGEGGAVSLQSESGEGRVLTGDGTGGDPYEIATAEELREFAKLVNGGKTDASAVLTDDIDLSSVCGPKLNDGSSVSWTPIGTNSNEYTGTFDGNDHTISGLYINDSSDNYQGLFGYVSGTVKDLGVSGRVSGPDSGTGNRVGGVVGRNSGTVENCYNTGSVSGPDSGSGNRVGGVVGDNSGTVKNCYNTGTVTGTDDRVGGVVGYNNIGGRVTNCYNTGSVSGPDSGTGNRVGGVVGYNISSVTNCYNTCSVSGPDSGNSNQVGGVLGYNSSIGNVTGCYNTGAVSGGEDVGGVVGSNSFGATVTNCYNTGSVSGLDSGNSNYVGGVVGDNDGTVENCHNIGDVTGKISVGGVVGENRGSVINCYNTGSVSGNQVGGVVGYNNGGSVTGCYFLQQNGVPEQGFGEGSGDATAKDNTAFHSGEVAWLLENGQAEDQTTPVWGQSNLTTLDSWPTLIALNNSAQPVYKVTVVYGDYADAPETETSYTNNPATPSETPSREGYTFDSWQKTTGEGNTITYTAKWTAIPATYTVTFDSQGGSAVSDQTVTEGQTITEPAAPTRDGYTFNGWFTKSSGGSQWNFSTAVTKNMTLYAKWTAVEEPTPTPTPDPEPSGPSTGDSTGWDDILDELENTAKGEQITIDMGDETKVPAEIFESLAGKDVEISFDLGDIQWSASGADIPTDTDFTDLDLGVNLGTSGIPVNVINTITGEVGTVQITLAHNGAFGFTMTLTAPLGKENAGYWANLYHYDESAEALNFEAAAKIDEDGSVTIPFSHASQYAIVIDTHSHATVDVSDIFIDIAPDAWYKDAVQYAYAGGLMTGVSDTEFAPEATTTRAMIVSILARLEGVTTAEAAGFADVDDNDWYATAVNWAANVGVVNGYEDNTFQPNTAITREQLAAILMNYAACIGEDVSNRADLTGYTDQPSTWAEETMQWAVAEGLISGVTADTLQPQGAATRAQVAAILQRFLSE